MAKKTARTAATPAPVPPVPPADRLRRIALPGALLLVLLATIRIYLTYDVFNHTIDEPAHLACGMQWLTQGRYTLEEQHPPLARVLTALGPYLDGARSQGRDNIYNEGAAILYSRQQYDRTLTLSRLGILPFFWLACAVVFLWTRHASGPVAALLATLLFTMLPPVLAHAGLATTDMALAATVGAAFYALIRWGEQPTWLRSTVLGLCLGAAILSKFSSLPFLSVAMLFALFGVFLPASRPRMRIVRSYLLPAALALGVACLFIWAGYRFSLGPHGLPAPELFHGIGSVIDHNTKGHPSYLLGQYSDNGFWAYYPIALTLKTPLGFLALALAGFWLAWQTRRQIAVNAEARSLWFPCALILGVLAVALFSRINIGTRHILPVYLGASVLAGYAALRALDRSPKARWTFWPAIALIGWCVLSSALNHPDYLPYFNELVMDQPERVLVDSDLDWGQDMKRLSTRLQELGARSLTFSPFISAHLEAVHGFPPLQPSDPLAPSPGWNAVSLTVLKLSRLGLDPHATDARPWPEQVPPRERVGRSTLLYYFPPPRSR